MQWLNEMRRFAAEQGNGWVCAYPKEGGECRLAAQSLTTGLTLSYELNKSQATALGELAFAASYPEYDEDGDEYPAHFTGSWEGVLEMVEAGDTELDPSKGQVFLSGFVGPVVDTFTYTGAMTDMAPGWAYHYRFNGETPKGHAIHETGGREGGQVYTTLQLVKGPE